MEPAVRRSMGWLHTWVGVVFAGLLFMIFWMGTLSVFDREIDRWMMPATRLSAPATPGQMALAPMALERAAATAQALALADGSPLWFLTLPTERVPALELGWRGADGVFRERFLDPESGAALPETGTLGASGFLYPLHYSLHLHWQNVGYWIVGLAAMGLLALCVSGIVIHAKLFSDFFTLRPERKARRVALDAHNVAGVVGLPFHAFMAFSGLVVFIGIYMPTVVSAPFGGDRAATNASIYGRYARPPAGVPAPQVALAPLVEQAARRWPGDGPSFLRVWHPGDANAYVEVRRSVTGGLSLSLDHVYFDGVTGAELSSFTAGPIVEAQRVISGLHLIQFRHWPLRFVYFLLGLAGCVMIASGMLFWVAARRRRGEPDTAGVRLVAGLTTGAVTGVIIATLVFLVVNRLLPAGVSVAGLGRSELEVAAFWLAWLGGFAHAWARPDRAWREQTAAIGGLAVAAIALNHLTTVTHTAATIGVDLGLAATATLAASVWVRLRTAPGASLMARTPRAGPVAAE